MDPVRGAGVQRTPKTFRRISINSILVISLVDGVFGTGLDGVVGSCNVVFCRARGGELMVGELAEEVEK